MQTNTTLLRSLAATVIIAVSIWTVTDAEKVSPCCVAVSRTMEDIPITGYSLQEKNLPCIKAVIFQTEKGQFCINPNERWVREKIMEFRRSQKNKMSTTSAPQLSSSVSTVQHLETTANHSLLP